MNDKPQDPEKYFDGSSKWEKWKILRRCKIPNDQAVYMADQNYSEFDIPTQDMIDQELLK